MSTSISRKNTGEHQPLCLSVSREDDNIRGIQLPLRSEVLVASFVRYRCCCFFAHCVLLLALCLAVGPVFAFRSSLSISIPFLQLLCRPDGVHNFRFVVLDKKQPTVQSSYSEITEMFSDVIYSLESIHLSVMGAASVVFSVLVAIFVMARLRRRIKVRRLKVTGRHKKYDVDPLFDA